MSSQLLVGECDGRCHDKVDVISQICRCQTRQRLVHQTCDLVVDSSPDRKTVQLTRHMRDVITSSDAGDEPCCGVLDQLKLPREAVIHTTTVSTVSSELQ